MSGTKRSRKQGTARKKQEKFKATKGAKIGRITTQGGEAKLAAREINRKFKKASRDVVEKTGKAVMKNPAAAGMALATGGAGGVISGPGAAAIGAAAAAGPGAIFDLARKATSPKKKKKKKKKTKRK